MWSLSVLTVYGRMKNKAEHPGSPATVTNPEKEREVPPVPRRSPGLLFHRALTLILGSPTQVVQSWKLAKMLKAREKEQKSKQTVKHSKL